MLDTLRITLLACLLAAGCSKKNDHAGQGSAAPAAPAANKSASPPSAGPAGCPDCEKFTTCCQAVVALPNSDVQKDYCEGYPGQTRTQMCAQASAEMQPDENNDCKERLADLQKKHPDVAACK
jgi:hypothetical protein